jgi:hypothetical protein
MPEGAVYVGRPSLFGNPWVRKDADRHHAAGWRAWCVERFRAEIKHWGLLFDYAAFGPRRKAGAMSARYEAGEFETFADIIRVELRGKDLACWCPLDQPCHADVLLEWANAEMPR